MKKLIFALVTVSFGFSAMASLGSARCKGSMWPNQGTVKRQVELRGKAFGVTDPNNRYEDGLYDLNVYQILPSGNLRGERRGTSNFNDFHYVAEIGLNMVKVWEMSTPHHNRVKITHYAECVLDRPLTNARFEEIKRSVL